MDVQVTAILEGIGSAEIDKVAGGVLGAAGPVAAGPLALTEILSAHGEKRTIGIVKASGTAEVEGTARPWSAVAKVVDFNIVSPNWTRPENEEIVYEEGYFASDGLRFRPARCYHVSRPAPGIKVLWLEDLTAATPAPFAVAELAQMVRHLGQWSGLHAAEPPQLKFAIAEGSIFKRWSLWKHEEEFARFTAMLGQDAVRTIYGDQPTAVAFELRDQLFRLIRRMETQPRSLAFGDCNIGNLFFTPGETIAVDWASLTNDPLGVDAGSMLGSAITWGPQFMEVARSERELFESYLAGLAASGWKGSRDDVRRGYLCHYGFYLIGVAILPVTLSVFPKPRLERRYQMPWEDIPARAASFGASLPAYVAELERLLA